MTQIDGWGLHPGRLAHGQPGEELIDRGRRWDQPRAIVLFLFPDTRPANFFTGSEIVQP
jgi:hypothetical protein